MLWNILMIILLVFLLGLCIPSILYLKFGRIRWLYHDILGWHQPEKNTVRVEDVNTHAVCKWCGKDIMQDSQGNWFE